MRRLSRNTSFVLLISNYFFPTHMKKQLITAVAAMSLLTACGGAPKTTARGRKI